MVRRRFFRAVSKDEACSFLILRDARRSALLRMRLR